MSAGSRNGVEAPLGSLLRGSKMLPADCDSARPIRVPQTSFAEDFIAAEVESARAAGASGYMARMLLQATLPHRAQPGNEFTRTNGHMRVSILAPREIGLPYGSYPRLLLVWLTSEAVLKKSRTLYPGRSLSEFMTTLGLLPTGGQWGTIARLRNQADRLFSACVTTYEIVREGEHTGSRGASIVVADEWEWWDTDGLATQGRRFRSSITLSENLFREVTTRPVPVSFRAIRAIKKSPLAIDIYAWATHRVSYLTRRTEVPWEALQMQFGADYAEGPEGRRNFRKKFAVAMRKVLAEYPALRAQEGARGLILLPSPTHVMK